MNDFEFKKREPNHRKPRSAKYEAVMVFLSLAAFGLVFVGLGKLFGLI